MRTPGPLRHLLLVLALAGCSPRPGPPPGPAPGPATTPVPRHAPAPPAVPEPPPPPARPPGQPLSDDERDAVLFTLWRGKHPELVQPFEEFLAHENLAQVVPMYQLLRSASMWKECHAEPFEVPPPDQWERVRDVLVLLRELQFQKVLPYVEVVSAYRDPRLNRCAGGAPGSSHQRFAVDIAPLPEADGDRLCKFWREQGKEWDMGVSRYPSGRIHIDRTGYRTWGASHKRGSSYCLQ